MPKTVLVVDDEADIVRCIRAVLEKDGYRVLTASDGAEGLDVLKTNTPDLMIVDLTMPVMNGWRMCMKVREDARFKDTPVIVLSALIESEHLPEQFEPASIYMVKPFDIFQLLAKVKELLHDA
jgi:DNA-binding response OmpR family regulator